MRSRSPSSPQASAARISSPAFSNSSAARRVSARVANRPAAARIARAVPIGQRLHVGPPGQRRGRVQLGLAQLAGGFLAVALGQLLQRVDQRLQGVGDVGQGDVGGGRHGQQHLQRRPAVIAHQLVGQLGQPAHRRGGPHLIEGERRTFVGHRSPSAPSGRLGVAPSSATRSNSTVQVPPWDARPTSPASQHQRGVEQVALRLHPGAPVPRVADAQAVAVALDLQPQRQRRGGIEAQDVREPPAWTPGTSGWRRPLLPVTAAIPYEASSLVELRSMTPNSMRGPGAAGGGPRQRHDRPVAGQRAGERTGSRRGPR